VGKLKLKLLYDVMRLRWLLLTISFACLVALPSLAQKLPPDLQQQVDRGFLTRQEAELLNSARGQTSPITPSRLPGKAGSKPTSGHCNHTKDLDPEQGTFATYLAALKRKVRQNWDIQEFEESRRAVLNFKIRRSGDITKVRVICASGDPSYDQAAIGAVQKAVPFEPFPSAYTGDTIEVNFTFEVHEVGGKLTTGG
jgi:TonB family protein